MKNQWDRISRVYLSEVKTERNSSFAYEKLVNSLAILSWCDSGGRVLDLGCGDGRFTKDLESRFEQVYAVDSSRVMISQAKKNCKSARFLKCDLETDFPSFGIKFDVVICKLLLMYIHNLDRLAATCYESVRKNGVVIISVTHPIKLLTLVDCSDYLREKEIRHRVANIAGSETDFLVRTTQTYVNTFAKFGFGLETMAEMGAPDWFVIKFPDYRLFQYKPTRLNLKFVKR